MITIYGTVRSRATRVVWAAEELGLPYQRQMVVFAASVPDPLAPDAPLNTASPAFLAINPMGQLPALRDGDLCMAESVAICLYLARKAGGHSLADEGHLLKWALFAASVIEPQATEILYAYLQKQVGTPAGDARVAKALEGLIRPLARLESHLATNTWLLGDTFSVADVIMAETIRYAASHPGAFDRRPAIKAWYDAAQARPAFRRMWAMREAE